MPATIPSQFKPLAEGSAEISVRTRSVQLGDGYRQRTPDGINTIAESWNVAFIVKSIADLNTLEAFLLARQGIDGILWTPPDSATPKTYIATAWTKQHLGGFTWKLSCKFDRVYL